MVHSMSKFVILSLKLSSHHMDQLNLLVISHIVSANDVSVGINAVHIATFNPSILLLNTCNWFENVSLCLENASSTAFASSVMFLSVAANASHCSPVNDCTAPNASTDQNAFHSVSVFPSAASLIKSNAHTNHSDSIAASPEAKPASFKILDISVVGLISATVAALSEFCACEAGKPLVVSAAVAALNSSSDTQADAIIGALAPNDLDRSDMVVLPFFTVLNNISATLSASQASNQKAFTAEVIISVASAVLDSPATPSLADCSSTFIASAVSLIPADTTA